MATKKQLNETIVTTLEILNQQKGLLTRHIKVVGDSGAAGIDFATAYFELEEIVSKARIELKYRG